MAQHAPNSITPAAVLETLELADDHVAHAQYESYSKETQKTNLQSLEEKKNAIKILEKESSNITKSLSTLQAIEHNSTRLKEPIQNIQKALQSCQETSKKLNEECANIEQHNTSLQKWSKYLSDKNDTVRVIPYQETTSHSSNLDGEGDVVQLTARVPLAGGVRIERYEINTSILQGMEGGYCGSQLHPVEHRAFELAIKDLSNPNRYPTPLPTPRTIPGDSPPSAHHSSPPPIPCNAVLVDIFVRDKTGNITQLSNKEPDSHTVLLWKKNDKEIVLIDPSSSEFSDHLISSINSTCSTSNGVQVVRTGALAGGKIYSETSQDKRDCVDVATKIGFVISHLEGNPAIKHEEIESNAILAVSNQVVALKKSAASVKQNIPSDAPILKKDIGLNTRRLSSDSSVRASELQACLAVNTPTSSNSTTYSKEALHATNAVVRK